MKILIVLVFVLAFQLTALCQQDKINKDSPRYPNELKGFELMQNPKLRDLIPGITTAEKFRTVYELLCDDSKTRQTGKCQLDENWNISFTLTESRDGNLNSIKFYPTKRIPFSKVRFPKQFSKGGMGIVHLTEINASKFIHYSDKYGLSYVIVDSSTDKYYKKGDLFFIEYGIPQVRSK